MKRHDIIAEASHAARAGGAFVTGGMRQVAMLSNPGALIRSRGVSA